MRVPVGHRLVLVPVTVRLSCLVFGRMCVRVVLVVDVAMLVLEGRMIVLMVVAFGHVQIHAERHQRAGGDQA